jgi:hypothetical protein
MGKAASHTFQIGENPVPPFVMETGQGGAEKLAVIHRGTWNWGVRPKARTPF